MSPDPAFLDYFAGPFQRELGATQIPGMADASWDRKAAWLLWTANNGKARSAPSPITSVMTTDKNDNSGVFG